MPAIRPIRAGPPAAPLAAAPPPTAPWRLPDSGGPGGVPGRAAAGGAEIIGDAEDETLLRTNANPLFRAAGPHLKLARTILLSDAAIDSFGSTGNRCSSAPRRRSGPGR